MNKRLSTLFLLAVLALAIGLMPVLAQGAVEVRFTWYSDGVEGAVMRDLLDRFEEANPGITVLLDEVPYATVRDNLRVQVEAGEAPDMARITDFAGMAGYYLDLRPLMEDPALMEENFNPAVLNAFRTGPDDTGLYGFPDQLSATAPFINRTLFEQAGVDVPSDVMEEPTWEDWFVALEEVAAATGLQYAFAIDNKGHRFAGPAMSMGATFFDEEGNFDLADDEGYRAFAMMLKDLMDKNLTPREIWLGSGQYASAHEYFVNVETVMYFSGSWQIGNFANAVGDAFDWEVVPNPYGPGGSTGVAGGAGIVGYNQTEHPEAVAMIMEYLLQPEVYAEYSARSLLIPAHAAVIEMGVAFETDNEAVAAALTAFANEVPKFQDQAVALNPHPLAFAYYDASNTRLAQYFAGELTLDEAMLRLQEQLDEAAAARAAGS
jgi:alpha-1,4-digalacturonate transport system substrate-binding protein